MAVAQQVAMTTEALYRELLAERAARTKFDPAEIRLSEVGGCGRRQTLRALGYTADAPTEVQQSIFFSGEEHEDTIYALWAARFPRRVRRQVPVKTPYGTGHIDIWVAPLRLIVESKSVQAKARSFLPMEHHLWQVRAYMHFWGHARGASAEIAYRLKETGEILTFPVDYRPEHGAEIERRLLAIKAAITTGTPLAVPEGYRPTEFPCAWYDRLHGEMVHCPFWSHCWEHQMTKKDGKEPALTLEGELGKVVIEYAQLDARLRSLRDQVKAVEKDMEPLEAALKGLMDGAGVNRVEGGGWEVRRSQVAPSTYYDVKAALEAGAVSEEALAPFARTRAGYTRWSVRKAEQA